MVMCTSWIREVRVEGTATVTSQSEPSGSAVAPVKAIVLQPSSLACSAARKTFFDFPLVLIAMSTSPGCARPKTCRANTCSYPRSLLTAVNADVSVVSAIAGHERRCFS